MVLIRILLAFALVLGLSACGGGKFRTYRGPAVTAIVVDKSERQMFLLHDSKDKIPAYFVVTLPGPQRAATRAFLKWLAEAA
mgnify:CR=1 FL=1